MFERRLTLFKLLGFEIRIDISWIILAFLIVWSLARGFFPYHYKYLPPQTYWFMGVAGALGLFLSIILHELSHSVVARRFGMPMTGITLFIFGGVAEMHDEPPNATAEFNMAIAGPLASVAIGFICHFIYEAGRLDWPVAVLGVLSYLRWINWILAGFNMIPAFPLDGGRILRALLWKWRGDLPWATHIASSLGSGFGMVLSALGIINFLMGAITAGIWWLLLGMFVNKASQMSYQKMLLNENLQGEPISRFMKTDVISVEGSLPLDRFVQEYLYRHHYKMFPVTENGHLLGRIELDDIRGVDHGEWPRHTVKDFVRACSPENTVSPDTDSVDVLSLINRSKNSKLLVVENGQLQGIVTLKDLLEFLSLKIHLEGK